jgi:predicted DNA-binding transcriptional regulator YafY
MPHPTTRVLAVLELLQTHARLSGAELAARLGVDRRTLRRYIVTLEQIGVPIVTERGRHGGYALIAGFKLPPLMLTDDEALAVALGLLAARHLGLAGASTAVASAQAKLERIMPSALKQRVRAVGESIELDLAPAPSMPDNALLHVLSVAALERQRVQVRYRAANGEGTERAFDPYGLVFHGGVWYALGWCLLRRAVRSFRLERIERIELVAFTFERPPHFNAVASLRASVATLPRAFAATVLLKTDLETARAHLFDAIGVLEQATGAVLLHNQCDDLGWLARQLAALPFDFEVCHPPQLAHEVRTLATRLLACAPS